jgi:predicted acetyltransferase
VPSLLVPTVTLEAAWREARDEWGPGLHEDGFGLQPSDDVHSSAAFAAWVTRLLSESREPRQGRASVRCTYRWIVEKERVLGGIALRHHLTDSLLNAGGHVGYGLRPSARGHGIGTWALTRMLDEARTLALARVLLVCADDNVASAKTIERCGGVLEDVRRTDLGLARRYWIALDGQ